MPSEFEIHYAYKDQKNNYLHELSRCVLQSCEVSYDGNFQTFRQFDDQGASCKCIYALTFPSETTILTKEQHKLLICHNTLKHF